MSSKKLNNTLIPFTLIILMHNQPEKLLSGNLEGNQVPKKFTKNEKVIGNWQEVETVSSIAVFSGMIYPPFFFMFIVFSGPLHVKKIARYPQGALPRSGMLPALRQHLLGSVKCYKQFVGIVFVFIMKSCLISCLDKAVKTSSLYRVVCGPIPINSSTALSGPRPHGFLFYLAAKEREETRMTSKSEIRISKFETNSNDQNTNDQNKKSQLLRKSGAFVWNLGHWDLEFVILFSLLSALNPSDLVDSSFQIDG